MKALEQTITHSLFPILDNCQMDICPCNICPGDICPYQQYLRCYWPDWTYTNRHSDICKHFVKKKLWKKILPTKNFATKKNEYFAKNRKNREKENFCQKFFFEKKNLPKNCRKNLRSIFFLDKQIFVRLTQHSSSLFYSSLSSRLTVSALGEP